MELLFNPYTILTIVIIIGLACLASPYEIGFEDGEDIEW